MAGPEDQLRQLYVETYFLKQNSIWIPGIRDHLQILAPFLDYLVRILIDGCPGSM